MGQEASWAVSWGSVGNKKGPAPDGRARVGGRGSQAGFSLCWEALEDQALEGELGGAGGGCRFPVLPSLSPPPQEFIEELLAPGFGGMIAFVKEAEALAERGQLERLRGEEGEWGGGRGKGRGQPPWAETCP